MLVNTVYKIRVTADVTDQLLLAIAPYDTINGFTTVSPNLCDGSVVFSQVYGGAGGTTPGVPNADYVVLHNRGSVEVDVSTWTVQYASATGSTWNRVYLSGVIPAGGYYLVRMSQIYGTGYDLPTPDATGNAAMSASAAKVALVNNSTALTGTCPLDGVVDFVGYGTTANCYLGLGRAPAISATTELARNQAGCGDMRQNNTDFVTRTPEPINSSAPIAICGCYVMNESGSALEADYCNLQYPLSLTEEFGQTSYFDVYGQIYEAGVTENPGAAALVRAQAGWGLPSHNPQYETWNWSSGNFNVQIGNNDEYISQALMPTIAGEYRFLYRFSLDQGVSWTYCDVDGSGSNAGLTFSLDQMGILDLL